MNKVAKISIVVVLLIAVGIVIAVKNCDSPPAANSTGDQNQPKLPRLVDLGAGKCIPCKMMAPILEELRQEYAGRLRVDVYDVWEDPGIGDQYGVRIIPTQIFYDAGGKELWRHEGFMSKEDILAKWKELGVDLSARAPTEPESQGNRDESE